MVKKNTSRRSVIGGTLALAAAGCAGSRGPASVRRVGAWPGRRQWDLLKDQVGGRLIQPVSPWSGITGASIPKELSNPWYLEEQAGATQSTGVFGAWNSVASPYAVAAESSEDIVAAVNFAREHSVRLVVKGTGHDYFGRSCAPDSLLVWTHNMRAVTVHEDFRPVGASESVKGVQALSVQAGNRWLEAYQAATKAGRYVQGGGCTSVGACGGFALGGGFGSYSKRFGSGAGGVLEMEVITADGNIKIVNHYQNADLFWALRGGGGGTFGVVSRMTLLTHPMPATDGWLHGSITAATDAGYRELIGRYVELVAGALSNPSWGEGVTFLKGKNTLELGTSFLDLTVAEAERVWAPLLEPLRARSSEFTVDAHFRVIPFKDKWNPDTNKGVVRDAREGAPAGYFWWAGNAVEVSAYWGGYQGRGVPMAAMQGDSAKVLADAFFNASRTSLILFQTNKALAGEHAEAASRDHETSLNPAVFANAGFATMADWVQNKHVGVAGHEPDMALARQQCDAVDAAMRLLKAATPGGGSYVNEGHYAEAHWKEEFWGSNYSKLLSIKRKYDPTHLFHVHHGVGSDG